MLEADKTRLTEEERKFLQDADRQTQNIQAQVRGALTLMLRQRGLEGDWVLSPDGSRFIPCTPTPQPQAQETPKGESL